MTNAPIRVPSGWDIFAAMQDPIGELWRDMKFWHRRAYQSTQPENDRVIGRFDWRVEE